MALRVVADDGPGQAVVTVHSPDDPVIPVCFVHVAGCVKGVAGGECSDLYVLRTHVVSRVAARAAAQRLPVEAGAWELAHDGAAGRKVQLRHEVHGVEVAC